MFASVKRIFLLLSPKEQKQLYGIVSAILVMGVVEIVGISSILPFLSVASNPAIIQSNSYLRRVYTIFAFSSQTTFLLTLGIMTILVLTFTQAYSAFTTYLIRKFTMMCHYTLSVRLFHKYVHQPYVYFLNHNSSNLNKTILSEVQQVVNTVLIPATELCAKLTVSTCIVGLLLFADPFLTILVALILGGAYFLIFMIVKNKLSFLGKARIAANAKRFKVTSEGFGGIKDIKILNKEDIFVEMFRQPAKQFSRYNIQSYLISSLPNYAISVIAFSGVVLITMYLIAAKENFQQALPMIGLYALAGYRLLPSIRSIYGKMTQIRFGLPAVELLYTDLQGAQLDIDSLNPLETVPQLPFKHEIALEHMHFTYPEAAAPVLSDIHVTIQANTSIGLVGSTGCGKTTLVDIILGLLRPQNGKLRIDGEEIHEGNLRNWQQNLGYVPQQIFLCDDTVSRNIAFGVPKDMIDENAVQKAARIANLHEFVVNELPRGYDTVVGEHGIRLSGGQRQRIGIARALYHNPSFLIFDEATSALDNITETAVMEAINKLAGQKTIITIAHRLTTVKSCDVIYVMESGKIVAQGNYETLLSTSAEFQKMVLS